MCYSLSHIRSYACFAGISLDVFQHWKAHRIPVTSNGNNLLDNSTTIFGRSMSMQNDYQTFDGLYQSIPRGCGPYEPSIASSASSSQSSIFSDIGSVQSSIASSISDDFRHNQEDARDRAYAQQQIRQKASYDNYNTSAEQAKLDSLAESGCPNGPSYADITSIPVQQRQHPRRSSLSRNQRPPTLQRQCERKINFVENLVGKHMNPLPH